MISGMFAVFDHKAKVFGKPFYENRVELAVRSVAAGIMDPQSMLSKFPEDFDLYRLGSFNDENGSFDLLPQPEIICKLSQLNGGKS